MAKVTKVVSVAASPDKVVNYISDVTNHPAFISALKSIDSLSGDPKTPGTTWNWTFMMGGVELQGKGETLSYKPGLSYSYKTTGGTSSIFTYSVEAEDGGSRLTMDVEYEVPDSVLAKVADKAAVERMNDQEGDRAVENIQTILSE